MPSLKPNIENRVRKLPKPSNASQGLLPIFEAVSNAIFAIEDRFGSAELAKGRINITVTNLAEPNKIEVTVEDNGVGMDDARYGAFCEIDTDFKKLKGGKGVGRLFWLDAFSETKIASTYLVEKEPRNRSFSFALSNNDQIIPTSTEELPTRTTSVGTTVRFKELRANEYSEHFPRRADTFLRYFSAHFIADFLIGNGPIITIDLDGTISQYPKEVADLVVGTPLKTGTFRVDEFGDLSIVGFTCHPQASTGLDGNHQLHLLANGRTVESRKIDNLLGLSSLERDDVSPLFFHGCVSGEFLDARVNEGRTAFNLPERTLKEISRACTDAIKEKLLPEQIAKYNELRMKKFQDFVNRHPIYSFDDADTLLDRVPFHATTAEDFAAGLVKYHIRREEARQDTLQGIIDSLDLESIPANFSETVANAAKDIQASEQLALAQHVVRRKLLLELLEKLLARVRKRDGKPDAHNLEKTLHSFICPMGIRGDDPSDREARSHDLWIVDERLAFTRAFSSDKRLDKLLRDNDSSLRPDLIMWDLAYGLGVTDPEKNSDAVDLSEPLKKVMVVEFKRPGRTVYDKVEDQVEQQILKYLAQLKNGEIETFNKDRVRIAGDCIFYCYIVADIIGDLKQQLSGWDTTANGEGRVRVLKNEYLGSIEVIQWQDLVNDAWMRNKAMIVAAGLSRAIKT